MKTTLIAENVVLNRRLLTRLLEDQCRAGCAEDGTAAPRLKIDAVSAAIPVIARLPQAMKGDAERGCSGLPRCPDRTSKREPCIREDCEAP